MCPNLLQKIISLPNAFGRFFQSFIVVFLLVTFLRSSELAGLSAQPVVESRQPWVSAQLAPVGWLANTTRMNVVICLPLRNQNVLSNLLRQIYDPSSANYHHYLSPSEFTEQFGPSDTDYQSVMQFAQKNGLTVTGQHSNRVLLDISGTAEDIQRVMHVRLRTYRHPVENRTFFGPDTAPSLDLDTPVLQISGLDNYSLPRPHIQARRLTTGQNSLSNAGSGPSGTFMGKDFRAAYVPDSSLTGSGQTVGLLQFDGYTASDIAYYESQAGLPSVTLSNVLLDGFSGNPTGEGGEVEVSLDIEMAISMAPGLSKVIVYEAGPSGNWHDILNRMATDNLARQLSCSWYIPDGGPDAVADQIWQQMAAQGQSFFNASGDNDAYSGLIPFPGDTPYITQVGGTTLTTSGPAGSWVSETVWNWGNGIGSGGGISASYAIPYWQTNVSMAANQGSTTMRNTPDVALTADNVYVRADGVNHDVGGTSCAAPLWAAFAALVNQEAAELGQQPLGLATPAVYAIGNKPGYNVDFHDITTGNNESSSSPTKFSAVSGYDLCTGWGTPAGQKLIDALANPEPLLVTPNSGPASIGGVGGPFTVSSSSFTLTNAGTNTLTWSAATTSSWLNVSPPGGIVTPGGPSALVTASLNNVASNLALGTYEATILFTNLNDHFGQGRQFTLSIIGRPTITQQPTNQAVLDGAAAKFGVEVGGGLPQYYQWQYNSNNLVDGGNISGSATTNLSVGNAGIANVGSYTFIVSNAAGVVVSSNASLTLIPSAPVIILQPIDQTAGVHNSAQFAVEALGTKPIAYQWSLNNTNLPGATNALLNLTNLQFSQAGNYSVTLTNIYGLTNSAVATLTVTPCDPLPTNLASWWPAEGSAIDIVSGNNGTLSGAVNYGPGEVGQAFTFTADQAAVQLGSPTNLWLQNFTIETWIKRASATVSSLNYIDADVFAFGYQGYGFGLLANGDLFLTQVNVGNVTITNGVTDTNWHHIAITKNGGTVVFYVDGVPYPAPYYNPTFVFDTPLALGARGDNLWNSFYGAIDELSVYSRALSASEIQGIYIAGSDGKCYTPTPPTIISQPTNQTVYVGQSASFSVSASSIFPLSYQWSFTGTKLPGATNALLTLSSVQLTNAGVYVVTVSTPLISTNSSAALLTVNDKLDHFEWNPISSPKFAYHPFSVMIEAMGTTNAVFTNFNGTVSLYDTNGIPLTPSASGNFVEGIWTGKVTVAQTFTNLVMKADAGSGIIGLANPIDISSVPNLGYSASGTFLLMYWPVSSSNFVLETSSSLAPAQWAPVSNPPLQIGSEFLQSLPMTATNQFYKLFYEGN